MIWIEPFSVSIVTTDTMPAAAAGGWDVGQFTPRPAGEAPGEELGRALEPPPPPPPNWIAPPARAAPIANTTTPMTASQAVGMPPLDDDPPLVGPAFARWVAIPLARAAPP